ncbi:hypothetical protein RHECNPAF_13300136 [Rhizobium etli CNPAF512]|nr:hypothetical protein RHECNPAF_13300136 [Rhizobium etli CNPAF512]
MSATLRSTVRRSAIHACPRRERRLTIEPGRRSQSLEIAQFAIASRLGI